MRLEQLHLINFRNYEEAHLSLEGGIHCFFGNNGSGKTNLLEAIHYLSLTRGSIHHDDAASVRDGASHFSISGRIQKNSKSFDISCTYQLDTRKKRITENGKDLARFADHIGKYPLVLISPQDTGMIDGYADIRRRFFDTLLAQMDATYLQDLSRYQSHLRQRNGLLKFTAEGKPLDLDLLRTYDEQLVSAGTRLYQQRKDFLTGFLPALQSNYRLLSDGRMETATIQYDSELHEASLDDLLVKRREADVAAGRTTAGIHRDDFGFFLDGRPLRIFGSQGQQKTFLIALRLAEFESLSQRHGFKPFLLLDDIFDKLDDERIHHLLTLVRSDFAGQLFITDARGGRSTELLRDAGVSAQFFNVKNGRVLAA